VVAVIVALVAVLMGLLHHKPAAAHDNFIRTLQPGEFTGAPGACKAVSSSLLSQYPARSQPPGHRGAN